MCILDLYIKVYAVNESNNKKKSYWLNTLVALIQIHFLLEY